MSVEKIMNVTCARCGTNHAVTTYDSINAGLMPDAAGKIISGELFQGLCPRCQCITNLHYNTLYNDQKHGAMIWLIHKGSPNYEAAVQNARTNTQVAVPVSRIVYSVDALREKVLCLESGRDDRIVELCKIRLLQNPEFKNVPADNILYTKQNGKELFVLTDTNGGKTVVAFPEADYAQLKQLFDASPYARTMGRFETVDCAWAGKIYRDLRNTAAEPKNHCPYCGTTVPVGAPFCNRCGNALKALPAQTAQPKKSGKAARIVAIILAVLLLGSIAGNVIQGMTETEYIEEVQELESYKQWYTQIIDDVGDDHDASASDRFFINQNIVVLKRNDPGYKLTLTAYWENGGEVFLSYSSSSATVSFDDEEWYDTTTVTVNPHSVGATVATFTNSVDDSSFKLLIIVTE